MGTLSDFLKGVYFFRGLSDEEIERIRQVCHQAEYQPGQVIFREGDQAERFYIVLDGSVEVWKDKDLLAVHTPGHLFGEMALIDELPRSATVVVRDRARLAHINRNDFHQIILENSRIAVSILRSVSDMVRRSNENFVQSLREHNLELEKANRALHEAQDELLRKERLFTLGKFSSLILHDIRNPISVVRSLAEMIMLRAEDRGKVERNARKIISEADRLNQLASELLDYSRGETRLNPAIVQLGPFFHRLAEAFEERFQARNIELKLDLQFTGPVIMDENRMMRVMLNLADNAWKAMPRGGCFTIRVWKADSILKIEAGDNGVGMRPEVQKRIFEPFWSSFDQGGTGLGMSIVKSIVEAHHGAVSFCSAPGKGTTFLISLPLID